MQSIPERLKNLRLKMGLTQVEFARELGKSASFVAQIEGGRREPSGAFLKHFALLEKEHSGGKSARVLEPLHEYGSQGQGVWQRVPLVRAEDAGKMTEGEEKPEPIGEVATSCGDQQAFALIVDTDSMEPRYSRGDHAVVMPEVAPKDGCLVFAELEGVVFFRSYHVVGPAGQVQLNALNPQSPPVIANESDFEWIMPVHSVLRIEWR